MSSDSTAIADRPDALSPDRDIVSKFIDREASLQDDHRYAEWEALWADDGIYWVPANAHDTDPLKQISFIYDNRARIAGRVRQLMSGRRHAQLPPSALCRVLSGLQTEVAGDLVRAHVNFILVEVRNGRRNLWCGRTRYDLRPHAGDFKLVLKKVMLVDCALPIPTLGFLI